MVTTADKPPASPDNGAEHSLPLLPVAEVEKRVKATIRQAASPVTREAMSSAYKAAIPGATVTVSPEGAMPWEGRGTRGHQLPGGMPGRVPVGAGAGTG